MVRMHGNNVNVGVRHIPSGDDQPNFVWLALDVHDLRESFHCRHQRMIAVVTQIVEVWLMLLSYDQRVTRIDGMFVEKGKGERVLDC
jgi:hypothetical protein